MSNSTSTEQWTEEGIANAVRQQRKWMSLHRPRKSLPFNQIIAVCDMLEFLLSRIKHYKKMLNETDNESGI